MCVCQCQQLFMHICVCVSAGILACMCVFACMCVCVSEGIIVCNSLLRPELPAADVSNNSECCGLAHTLAHTNTRLTMQFPAV